MTKVSVIIPYHNVETYITQCLNSVVNQTLTDIEIILINDASDDNSENIAKEFALKDNRIVLLNTKELSGQAFARNKGLEIAKGEYIGFVDADDRIELLMFEKMYNRAKSQDTDITMCGAILFDDATSEYTQNDYYSLKSLQKFGDNCFSACDTGNEILNINVVLWNKIYKNEFLKKTGERFAEGFIYEDLPFFFGTYLKAKRVNIVWEDLYYYRQNRQYSTMQNIDKKIYDRIPMVSLAYEKIKQASFYKEKKIQILSWIIDDIFHRFTLLEEKYYKEYFYSMKKLFLSFDLTEEEKSELSICYSYEEFCSILKDNYFDFWKFLIEKYKLINQHIKQIRYENNQDWTTYKIEQAHEKEEVINWWRSVYNNLQDAKYNESEYLNNEILHLKNAKESLCKEIDKLHFDYNNKLADLANELNQKHSNELNDLYNELNDKMVKQEYELKRWQSKSVRECREKVTADFKWKLENQKQQYQNALKQQKEYYENNFLLVKINIKIRKIMSQMKNKIKRFLKKN